ncbi:MAG: DUF1700 domain-containing protein [Eubacterium sp.]|nr:DUF1700 domain-containing protein [Eubacterium sp.]
MNKEQFFRELEECLQGEVSNNELAESMAYYRDYFRSQEASGHSEAEVIASLGSPRLIARSIIEARGRAGAAESSRGYYDSGETSPANQQADGGNDLLKKIGSIAVIILILLIVGTVVRALLPVIFVIIIVLMILRLFRR